MNGKSNLRRIHFIDEVRGFDIILMVIYHAFSTAGFVFGYEWGMKLFVFFQPVEPFFAGIFIFICGISCRLSRSNLKRGGILLLIALGITLFLWVFMPEHVILFGILHFLSVAILLFALLRPALDRIKPLAGITVCAALLLFTWWVPYYNGHLIGIKGIAVWKIPQEIIKPWLYPLGLGYLPSSDYFPILPWIFCFFAGSFAGVWAADGRLPEWMYRQRAPFLSAIGRRALLIYILHQPVIFAAFYIATQVLRLRA